MDTSKRKQALAQNANRVKVLPEKGDMVEVKSSAAVMNLILADRLRRLRERGLTLKRAVDGTVYAEPIR